MRTSIAGALLSILTCPCFAEAPADCSTFTWDLKHELALFAGAAKPLASALDAAAAPTLVIDTLYTVELHPLTEVVFAHRLGKSVPTETGSGGLFKLHVGTSGSYRITLDAPLWIDVVAGNSLVESTGFQGRQPCRLIHKSVEWLLPADADLVVQLAGAVPGQAKLAVTKRSGIVAK